jgi:hypothetical protein
MQALNQIERILKAYPNIITTLKFIALINILLVINLSLTILLVVILKLAS